MSRRRSVQLSRWASVAFSVWLASAPEMGFARSRGISSSSCEGCHGGGTMSQVSVRFEPEQLELGGTGTLIVEVSTDGIAAAGVAVLGPDVGTFEIPQGEPLALAAPWVTHTQPKTASGGKVEFRVEWTAPSEPGVAVFEVAALATNGDNRVSGDKPGGALVNVGCGCEPMTMYYDGDKDGFGREDSWILTCGGDDNYVATPGDCGDSDVERHPGAVERCNGKDDDCDGEVDEDALLVAFHPDVDQDGFGDPDTSVETCTPEAGWVEDGTDCDDRAGSNYPGGVEVCDYVDNDCDGDVDEELRPRCGVGLCQRVSDLCDSTTACIPGEPFVEACNGLDDDCDGKVDNDSCPAGQACYNHACVDVNDLPVGTDPPAVPPAATPGATPPSSNPPAPGTSVTPSPVTPPVTPGTPVTPSTPGAPPAATTGEGESSSGENPTPPSTSEPQAKAGGCGLVPARREGLAWFVLGVGLLCSRRWRMQSRNAVRV